MNKVEFETATFDKLPDRDKLDIEGLFAETLAALDAVQTQHLKEDTVIVIDTIDDDGKPIQVERLEKNVRFLQLLPLCEKTPSGDKTETTDIEQKADSNLKGWEALADVTIPEASKVNLSVTEYDGPDGVGWELVAETEIDGIIWRRVETRGPETWRSHGWMAMSSV